MICPKCGTDELAGGMGAFGVEVDRCGSCGGVWLDKGELGVYFKDASKFDAALGEALKTAKASFRRCPRCVKDMLAARLEKAGVELDSCPNCSGLWLDKGEFDELKKALR